MAVTVLSLSEQAVGQQAVEEAPASKKPLTNLLLDRGDLGNDTTEDGLQTLVVRSGDIDATGHDIGGDAGGGRRDEEAEGEGGEGSDGERTHCGWIMSVGGKESDLIW